MNLVTTENIQVVQYSCLRWFSESATSAFLAIFLIACLGALPCPQTLAQDIQVDAELELKTGTREGLLTVTAAVPDGWHTYSLTQPAGGPIRSTLKLNGPGIQLIGDFVAQQEPERHDDEFMGPAEEYRGVVAWVARVKVSPDVEPAKLDAKVDMYAQICQDLTQQCYPPTTYSGEIDFLGERADLEFPETVAKERPANQLPNHKRFEPADEPDNEFIEADTPEQIAAMARLYDVNEPIKYIDFSEMDQFPIGSASSAPSRQTSLLIVLLFAFIGGAIISWTLYLLSGHSDRTNETVEQDGSKPAYPRMRRLALAAGLIFSICILIDGLFLIAGTGLGTTSDKTHQYAPTITWTSWRPGKVAQQLNQNKIVWVNYTADWDPTSNLNEVRVASNTELVKRMHEMEISFVAVDLTQRDDKKLKDLKRSNSRHSPVNLIYPPNYPKEPAIKLEVLFSPTDVHLVLDRMEAIVSKLKE